MADRPACLCIVARDRIRGSDFIAALEASLRPDDPLEIIRDRRSGEPTGEWERAADRRQRPQVDLALKVNGFAVVPAPSPKGEREPLSWLLPSAPSPRPGPDDDDEERLEAIRSFKRKRSSNLVPWLVAGLAVAAAAVAFVWSPTGDAFKQSLAHRTAPETSAPASPPTQTPDASTATRSPAVAEEPRVAEAPPGPPANDAPPVDRSTRDPAPPATTEPPTPTSRVAPASPRDTRPAPAESSAPPSAASRGRSRPAETARPSSIAPAPRQAVVVPAPAEPVSRAISSRVAGLPRVELSREPAASGGVYAVRIVDPAGKPLEDAEVLLLARMPDGTVENVRMDFSPDHGTYRGALPPARSSPVDLRVRVITGDKRVEIPLGP